MISLFKNNNPLALLALACIAAFPFVVHSGTATVNSTDDATLLKTFFNGLLDRFGATHSTLNTIASTCVLYAEALLVNKIISDHKLLERPGFVPALSFLLLHALAPVKITGVVLLSTLFMIGVLRILISIYKSDHPNNSLLTAGFATGTMALLNTPFSFFYVWLCAGILIMRPTSLKEWLLATAGFVMPFYFMGSGLYLTDQFSVSKLYTAPDLKFIFPELQQWDTVKMLMFTTLPLLGMVIGNNIISKMMILNRKSHIILLIHFLAAALVCLGELEDLPATLHMLLLSGSVMLSSLFLSFKRELIPNLLFWTLLAVSLLR